MAGRFIPAKEPIKYLIDTGNQNAAVDGKREGGIERPPANVINI
jgi:hypothetical protein